MPNLLSDHDTAEILGDIAATCELESCDPTLRGMERRMLEKRASEYRDLQFVFLADRDSIRRALAGNVI